MNQPRLSIIAAIGKNRALGKDNKLLWHISADLKRFKELTTNHTVIMGRKTYESIGRPLPNRTNIVVTKDPGFKPEGALACASIEDALSKAKETETQEIFVIGGGKIYEQFLPLADRLYLTLVDKEYEADTFFPSFDDFKKVVSEQHGESEGIKYKFLELER